MSVKDLGFIGKFFIAVALLVGTAGPLRAATIEIEEELDELAPTPVPSAKANLKATGALPAGQTAEKPMPRVRIAKEIGFSYFLKSGFVIPDAGPSGLGTVIGQYEDNLNYSTPKKTY